MKNEKIDISIVTDIPDTILPIATFSLSKIIKNEALFIICSTRHCGESKMHLVTSFYKPLILL